MNRTDGCRAGGSPREAGCAGPFVTCGQHRGAIVARSSLAAAFLTLAVMIAGASRAAAQEPPPDVGTEPPAPDTAPVEVIPQAPEDVLVAEPYLVDEFVFRYADEHPEHPDISAFGDVEVDLAITTTGYIAPREGFPDRTIRLGDVPNLELRSYYPSALNAIFTELVERLQDMDLLGVYVSTDPTEINPITGEDRRPVGETNTLTVVINTAVVAETRTLAFGDRIPDEDRENNPLHSRIRERSPLQVWDGEGPRHDLLRQSELDRYLARLNRLPGRRVDAAVSAAEEQAGAVVLDYLVAENDPLLLYFQISNTGTKETDTVRERFGLIANQVTGNDDILSIEYVTANFDASHAVIGSYEAPLGDSDVLRWAVNGSWNEFTASDVGIADEDFSGDSWNAGGELYWNVYQYREFFLDLYAGARWSNVHVTNDVVGIEGDTDFFLPYVGTRFERRTSILTTEGFAQVEWNLPDTAGTDEDELDKLGRLDVDEDWTMLRWNASLSFYLEPVLNREAWENIDDRATSTLAHEMYFAFRGQYAFDNRVIPQEEQVIGGLYTVRGYDESIVAGDTVLVGTVEYRFHLPKAFPYQEEPDTLFGRPFRSVPQEPYGAADWDLILRGFFDVGYAEISDPLPFEREDETLMGAGVGVELSLYRNINLRLDWGFTLEEVEDANVDRGSNRLHFVGTFIF